ncbi:MAG: GAF domain-containing protein [Anaerolineae bacterium]|nr:MAG: GAF domain-containing protein [Anaerolineae bacterium]
MTTGKKRVLLVLADEDTLRLIQQNILASEPVTVTVAHTCAEGRAAVQSVRPDLLVLGDNLPDGNHLALATELLEKQPTLPIILFSSGNSDTVPRNAVRLGLVDWITPPIGVEDFRTAVRRGLSRSQQWQNWLKQESARYTGPLLQQVDELQTLARVGRSVSAQLDLDRVLEAVVDAAAELTGAEEASLLLLERETDSLVLRAAHNFKEELGLTVRLDAIDSLAGEVLNSGVPLILDAEHPQKHKISTQHLVYSLIYVPMTTHGETIGVLGVDNRESQRAFEPRHMVLLTALADYAAAAIENARLYDETERERGKLESILTRIIDGVIVTGPDGRLALVNPAARRALAIPEGDVAGKLVAEVIHESTVLQMMNGESQNTSQVEIEGADERVYELQLTPIEGVGSILSLHDISYLKELDRIKSDFVNTVSHDLRSPLTAILGYVELIGRVGPVNEQQEEFIRRALASVKNITELITDLLHLGRVEIGMDEVQPVHLSPLITQALETFQPLADEKKLNLTSEYPPDLPVLNGNTIRMRQVLDNLIGNAIKYTPSGGTVSLNAVPSGEQLILRVIDSGVGIPAEEQGKVFDRFYRATNVPRETPGTGLGLAITKQIVENHGGRIWVESSKSGTVFSVVLPVANE